MRGESYVGRERGASADRGTDGAERGAAGQNSLILSRGIPFQLTTGLRSRGDGNLRFRCAVAYIVNLIPGVVRVSMETMKIVKKLPARHEQKNSESGSATSLSSVADRAWEAVRKQFGGDSRWQGVTSAVMKLLETRADH